MKRLGKLIMLQLDISLKPGGMICRKANYVFSLVKTCRNTPIGGKWKAYENLFLKYTLLERKKFRY